jgi:hypothetical protein
MIMVNCYSIDGKNICWVEKFVGGGPGAADTASGQYSGVISVADGLPFYIGWRWTNDDNAGSQFSFIDNVVISATPARYRNGSICRGTEKSIKSSTVGLMMLFIF